MNRRAYKKRLHRCGHKPRKSHDLTPEIIHVKPTIVPGMMLGVTPTTKFCLVVSVTDTGLRHRRTGQIVYDYKFIDGGAFITFVAQEKTFLARWFPL